MKWEDPIVKETRTVREHLVKEAGGFEAYVKKLQQKEVKHKKRILRKEQAGYYALCKSHCKTFGPFF